MKDYLETVLTAHNVRILRPVPPAGFIRWTPKKYIKVMDTQMSCCPECDQTGFVLTGGGFTDPEAIAVEAAFHASGYRLCGAGDPTYKVGDTPLFMHWSRYGWMYCNHCGLKFWHDMGGGAFDLTDGRTRSISHPLNEWRQYYQPQIGQLVLF